MSRFTYSIHIGAPPERVFDVLTDPRRRPEWDPGVEIKDFTDPSAAAIGTDFTIVGSVFGRRTESRRRITQFERPKIFGHESPRAKMLVRLEPAAGGTDLAMEEEFVMPLGLVGEWAAEHLFKRWVMSEIDKTAKRLRALVEAEVPAHA